MKEYNFPLPGLQDEKVVIFTRRHWASLIGSIFLILAMLILPPVTLFGVVATSNIHISILMANIIVLVGTMYYLVLATFVLTAWIDYYYDILIITEKEIIDIDQEGIFNREITEISMGHIQDVSSQIKGFLPTLFAYGSIIAESAGERTQTYIINDVPNPMEISSKILELHNKLLVDGQLEQPIISFSKTVEVKPPATIKASIELPDLKNESFAEQIEEYITRLDHQPIIEKNCPDCICPPGECEHKTVGKVSKEDLNKGGEVKF